MKRLIAFLLLLILCFILTACGGPSKEENGTARIKEIYRYNNADYQTIIFEDSETGVLYFWHRDVYCAGITPMYNPDGTLATNN